MGALADAISAQQRRALSNLTEVARFATVKRVLPDAVFVAFDGSDAELPCDWLRHGFGEALATRPAADLIGSTVVVLSVSGSLVIADLYVKGAK